MPTIPQLPAETTLKPGTSVAAFDPTTGETVALAATALQGTNVPPASALLLGSNSSSVFQPVSLDAATLQITSGTLAPITNVADGLVKTDAGNTISGQQVLATGATADRTLAAWFGDFANAKAFGAKGDGSTDDTSALQAAFNSGIPIRLVSGSYNVTSPLTLPVGAIVIADDVNAYDTSAPITQIVASGSGFSAGSAVLTLGGYNFLRGFSVTSVSGADAIASTGRFVSLERVYTTAGRYGCNLNGIGPQLRYCRFSGASSHGLYAQSSVTDGTFIGNFCNGNGGNGAQFLDSIKCLLIGNTFEWNSLIGLEIYSARSVIVSGNAFDRNSQAGLRLNTCKNLSVVGNEFSRNGVSAGSYDCHVSFAGANSAISFAGNDYIAVAENDDGTGAVVPDYTFQMESGATIASSTFADPQTPGNTAVFVNAASQDALDPFFLMIKQGTQTNDNALAGEIGEYLSATGSYVGLSNGSLAAVATLTLTPGDWDAEATVTFNPAASTTSSFLGVAINTSSSGFPASGAPGQHIVASSFAAGVEASLPTGRARYSVSANTTIYLVVQANFAVSTMTASGTLFARRVR